jgi:hypothetical protein
MNYYERIIREGTMAADEYTKKKDNPIEELHITEQELEELDLDALMVLEDLVDPFDHDYKYVVDESELPSDPIK